MRNLSVILILVGVLAGCSSFDDAADPSEAQYRWLRGELKTAISRPLADVERATRGAFDELRLVGVDGSVTASGGALTSRMADGTRVRVRMQAAGAETTIVGINVGQIGDEPISLQVLRHIQRQLEAGETSQES
jgi:hypothetical protein